ncbi:hypothetical protein CFC21_088987 [Triticum aestivum]|uniref:Fatty acid desaturase domain-containing protein n=2 Tax=Triticum aestivum TaxID=4565 RepID=A0A3B6PQY7_WHEAT|nr:hypothetical protein CFC21_088987 [Triticum aestivum]
MGAGGRMTEKEREKQELLGRAGAGEISQRAPTDKPAFTLAQIRKAIPPHCFQRSVIKSFSYVVYDLAIIASLLYAALVWIPALPTMQQLGAWPLYWAAQGCVMTGVWVLAHECGHHAFSDYLLLDNIVGLVLHSCLLVPYFSWKYSHRRHHANTGSLEHDEVYVPKKEALPWYTPYIYNNPVGRLGYIVVQLTLGWPMYLALNTSGRPYPRFVCHYDPYGPLYSDLERAQVFISDVGVLAVSFALLKLASAFGFWWVVRVYGVPLLIVNAWLVVITYLAHTHPALPHYDYDSPPWTVTWASSIACSTTPRTRTSRTISSPAYRTTTPWRPPRRSSPSSASTTSSNRTPSPGPHGARPRSASTSSPRIARESFGTATSSSRHHPTK